jgi:hypothetical protein
LVLNKKDVIIPDDQWVLMMKTELEAGSVKVIARQEKVVLLVSITAMVLQMKTSSKPSLHISILLIYYGKHRKVNSRYILLNCMGQMLI